MKSRRRPSRQVIGSTMDIGLLVVQVVLAQSLRMVNGSTITSEINTLKCLGGWGSSKSVDGSTSTVDIPEAWINDGYCDCPYDGLDETDTNACSGSKSWPGIPRRDDEIERDSPTFVCPQQQKLKLPLSRLNDGICDCCDGADETIGVCVDNCEEVLREEREAREKLERDFEIGSKKRQQDLEAFQTLRSSKLQELEEKEQNYANLDDEVTKVQGQIRELKQNYAKSRMSTMKDDVGPSFDTLLSALDRTEIESLIVHSCQVAGEILSSSQPDNTCVPLRMAGLDMGLTWSDDDYSNVDGMSGENEASMEWVNLLFDNALSGGRLKWRLGNSKKNNSRRRLDEVFNDDYLDSMPDSDMEDPYYGDDEYREYYGGTDDYVPEDEQFDDEPEDDEYSVEDNPEQDAESMELELIDSVKATSFSATRVRFLDHASQLIDQISKLLETTSQTDDEESEDTSKDEIDSANEFDPAAYTMVRSQLRTTDSAIRKGLRWAASAKLLFKFSDQSDENLKRLAVGTIYYGQLNDSLIWQILQSIIPELSRSAATPDDTCASPWANRCPPKVLSRESVEDDFPPDYILIAGQKFCDGEALVLSSTMAETCSASDDSNSSFVIPTSIPHGYYGYMKPVSRTAEDQLSVLFSPIDSLDIDKSGLDELEKKKKDLEKEMRDLQRDIDDGWKDVGGKDGSHMGPDGELHSLADQCISVDAGKYTYETCVFGKATQRDVGQKAGGTNLGNWRGMSIDEDSGRRVMKWDGGMKCWNGPQRSATIYVTCGVDTKLISADEPDTCRYVMEMESHIACDDAYRAVHGL